MTRRETVLAVASAGGHWVQLRRLGPAFAGREVVWVTTDPDLAAEVAPDRLVVVPDASRARPLRLLQLAARLLALLVRERPRAVVTTGAAPGFLALRLGRLLGARTAWIDSAANVEELSLSGRRAGRAADLWLTQWPELARPEGPHFAGDVL